MVRAHMVFGSIGPLVFRRLLHGIPVLLGVTFLTFALMNLLPGSAATALAGPEATPEVIRLLEIKLNLDTPFFPRYLNWLGGLLVGDLGQSLASGQPVADILSARLPTTAQLIMMAFMLSVTAAVIVGILAARRPFGILDRATSFVSMAGLAIPDFVSGLVLIIVFAGTLRILPAVGYVPLSEGLWPNIRSFILPATALGFGLFCRYVRVFRADLIDQVEGEDYIVTARAKGVGPYRILFGHAVRNSLFGLITLVGINLGVLIGGTIITEKVFGLPGMGQQLVNSIVNQDVVVVQGVVVTMALAVVAAAILTDLLYAVLDPRVRHRTANV